MSINLDTLVLRHGSHADRDNGVCAMEAVAWLAGLPHTDAPSCACPVIRAFVISLNDRMDDQNRQKLKAYLPRIIGTRTSDRSVMVQRCAGAPQATPRPPWHKLHCRGRHVNHASIPAYRD